MLVLPDRASLLALLRAEKPSAAPQASDISQPRVGRDLPLRQPMDILPGARLGIRLPDPWVIPSKIKTSVSPRNEVWAFVKTLLISLFSCVLSVAASGQTAAFVVGEKLASSIGFYDANFHRIGDVKVGTHPLERLLIGIEYRSRTPVHHCHVLPVACKEFALIRCRIHLNGTTGSGPVPFGV